MTTEHVPADAGTAMHGFIADLYPICRSLTGDGVRATLEAIATHLPLDVVEVPSGTRAFDWEVPREWNVRAAWISDESGDRVVDFADSNLHLVGYSGPVHEHLGLEELRTHLHSAPERPDAIPYRTSYFNDAWGFCLQHRRLEQLREGRYEVVVETTLEPGSLTYGEVVMPGRTEEEFLISAHVCHPSLCNDNLSGIAVATWLAKVLAERDHLLTYRFLFAPGLLGPIVWLARNEEAAARIGHGLVLACIGDGGGSTYKRTRAGDAHVDRAAEHVLRHAGGDYEIRDFVPFGYDERQFNSPGFALPVGLLMRTPFGEYPEYHTSDDDLDLVRPDALADSLEKLLAITEIAEHDRRYVNLNPKCEPQLGRRGLYRSLGGGGARERELALLWVLNLSDGRHSLLDIAERAGLRFSDVRSAADALVDVGLLATAEEH